MKLVIDTNILISALIKDSLTRELLLFPSIEFLLPEYSLEEIENHKTKISKYSGLTSEDIDIILSILLENISIIPADKIKPHLKKASEIIGHIDLNDVPFVALALSTDNDGIWTNDKHFERTEGIKVWKTPDLRDLLHKEGKGACP